MSEVNVTILAPQKVRAKQKPATGKVKGTGNRTCGQIVTTRNDHKLRCDKPNHDARRKPRKHRKESVLKAQRAMARANASRF